MAAVGEHQLGRRRLVFVAVGLTDAPILDTSQNFGPRSAPQVTKTSASWGHHWTWTTSPSHVKVCTGLIGAACPRVSPFCRPRPTIIGTGRPRRSRIGEGVDVPIMCVFNYSEHLSPWVLKSQNTNALSSPAAQIV